MRLPFAPSSSFKTGAQICVPSFVSATGCNMNASVPEGNSTAFKTAGLDLCTVEGIPVEDAEGTPTGASLVTGMAKGHDTFPNNTCRQGATGDWSNDRCDHPDYQCDLTTVAGATCTCDAASGTDTCVKYSACVKTPCRVCSDCLANVTVFTRAQQFNQITESVRAGFASFCASAGFSAAECQGVQAAGASLNQLKRAGWLCNQLGRCDPLKISASPCSLKPDDTVTTTDGIVDMCTVEGTTLGAVLPGTLKSGLPTGTCETSSNCNAASKFCDRNTTRALSKCAASTGSDLLTTLGVCRHTPQASCNKCLSDFAVLPDHPWEIACESTGRASPDCSRALQLGQSSFRGNSLRRAGAFCVLLGECLPTQQSVTVNGTAGNFSLCTSNGLSSGQNLDDFSSTQNTTGCRWGARAMCGGC